MKCIVTFALFLLSVIGLFAQDIINTVDGKQIESIVIEIGVTEISYRNWNNPNGPTYKILKKDVSKISYRNGFTDTFNESGQTVRSKEQTSSPAPKPEPQPAQPGPQPTPPPAPVPKPQSINSPQQITATFVNGNLYDANGSRLSEYAQRTYLDNMYDAWVRAKRKNTAGDVLCVIGSTFCAMSIIFACIPDAVDPSAVWGTAIPGIVLDIIGIPLSVTGKKQMKRIYYDKTRARSQAWLTFGSQRFGTGVALQF